MAATYTASFTDIPFGNNKSLATIFNGVGSGKVINIYRIVMLNNQLVAVANGVVTTIELRRITESTGGSSVTAIKHDNNSANLPAQVTVTTGATDTVGSDTFRRFLWSTDEPIFTSTTLDEWQCIPVFNTVWDSGYAETNIDPIVCREGYGITLKSPGSNTQGQCDIFIEFTVV